MLELLLSTAIGAIVLLVINGTFFGALRLHNTTHQKIDDDLMVQRTLAILRKDFAGIMVPANPQATTNTLSGQLQSDTFLATSLDNTSERITPDLHTNSGRIDGWTSFADVQVVAYFLSPSADGGPTKTLVRSVTRNLLPASADNLTEDQTLLTGVTSASIAYFDGEYWVDTWDSVTTTSLPTAIKLTLMLAPRESASTRLDAGTVELLVPVIVKTATTAQQEATAAAAAI